MRRGCEELVKCEGQLCLVRVEKGWMEIWVMASYKEERWEKRKVVASLEAIKDNPTLSIKDLYLPDVSVMDDFFKIIW